MHRLTSLILAAAITLATTLALHAVASARPATRPATRQFAAPRFTPTPTPDPCIIAANHSAAPDQLDLGEIVTVTLHLTAECPPPPPPPMHIVLVIDPSAAMAGPLMRDLRDVATKLVDKLNLIDNPNIKLAVVEVQSKASRLPSTEDEEHARTLVHLTNTELRVKNAIKRVQAQGQTRTDLGIKTGLQTLLRGRMSLPAGSPQYINELMIVFSDGNNSTGCNDILNSARQVKSHGVILLAVCVGDDCDTQCLRQAASSSRYFFGLDDASRLNAVFDRIRKDIIRISLRQATITDLLPPSAEFLPGSEEPGAYVSVRPEGTRLSWTTPPYWWDSITVTYLARPLAAGRQPISLGATAEFRDTADQVHKVRFQIPFVDVQAASSPPTSTPPVP